MTVLRFEEVYKVNYHSIKRSYSKNRDSNTNDLSTFKAGWRTIHPARFFSQLVNPAFEIAWVEQYLISILKKPAST